MLDLRNIDCMKLMAEYPDKHFDIAIVDPPYGIDRAEWDNRPTAEYWKELFRVSKEQIVFGGNYFGLPITENWLCWDKTNNGKSFFKHKAKFELIWLSIETKPDLIRTSGKTFSHNKYKYATSTLQDTAHIDRLRPAYRE